jgi:DNA-binding MarR family transcriptional regulator
MNQGRTEHSGYGSGERLRRVVCELVSLVHQRTVGDTLAIVHKHGLTLPQMVALFGLRESGAQTVSNIAQMLNLSRAATSHLIDRLVRAHLVVRAEDAVDRRQKHVSVSERGKALLSRVDDARRDQFDFVLKGLSAVTRDRLTTVLEQVTTQLRGIG